MIGIGIDTGGTCTDAAVFHTDTRRVLSHSKTLTTKDNLKTGILKALKELEPAAVKKADYISLSTTLATNACIEHKGGRAKLVLIGATPDQIEKTAARYGLPPVSEIYFMAGNAKLDDSPENTPDWEKLKKQLSTEFAGYTASAVVQINPKYDNGAYEKKAREIITESLGISCVCGYQLYQDLNMLSRASTALLNARLLPIMQEFFTSIEESLSEMHLNLPIVIVRSDGTIMSKAFAMERPVETLFCGPAASIIGAAELSAYQDALIVDMGGTTSDVALIRNGEPVSASSGISIGEWKTMVKGVSIDTFALGGDTAVKYKGRSLFLGKERYIPLCVLADRYPEVLRKLRTLVQMNLSFSYPAHEFFLLVKKPASFAHRRTFEQKLIKALEKGPLTYKEAAEASGVSPHIFHPQNLEAEGIIMRSGMTPTDAMHLQGDYREFCAEASALGAAYLSKVTGLDAKEVSHTIYEITKSRLYSNLVRILLQHKTGAELSDTQITELEKLTSIIFKERKNSSGACLIPSFTTSSKIIGIGAPTKIFLEDAAKLLGTEADFPEFRKVANAVGAAAGNINTEYTVRIELYKDVKTTYPTYLILGGPETFSIADYDKALAAARNLAENGALERGRQQGMKGALKAEITIRENTYQRSPYSVPEHLNTEITAKAVSVSEKK